MKCNLEGCDRDASLQIGFKVWAYGFTKASAPLTMLLGLACCKRCKHKVKVEHFVTEEGKAQINALVRAAGRMQPDFASAELHFDPIVGGQLKMMGGANG
jgi:hypothetical protein